MKLKTFIGLAVIQTSLLAGAQAALKLKVMTSSPEGFLVNSTLISGEKDAILIDAQFTAADAEKVVAAIQASKKNLTTIYITHSHPDHYFGLNVLKKAFSQARVVAVRPTIENIEKTWQAKVDAWKPSYGDAIPSKPIVPEELKEPLLMLDGEKLEIVEHVQGDETENTFVWIPSLKAVIAGDIVYNGVFPWTAETNPAQRQAWLASLEKIKSLNPGILVAGHKIAGLADDRSALKFMRDYLKAFDEARLVSKTPAELFAKMKTKYPILALEIILKIGADAAFAPPATPK